MNDPCPSLFNLVIGTISAGVFIYLALVFCLSL